MAECIKYCNFADITNYYTKLDTDPLPAHSLLLVLSQPAQSAISFHAPSDWTSWSIIVLIAMICLMLSAFVSGSEISYFGLSQTDIENLEEDETPNAQKALKLVNNPEKLLATILIANNLVNITMVVLLTFAINQVVIFHSAVVGFLLQTVLLTFLLLLFGEIFPKLVARGRSIKWLVMEERGKASYRPNLTPFTKKM